MKEELIDQLLQYFMNENPEYQKMKIPNDEEKKRDFLRGLINLRDPEPIPDDILVLEDRLLEIERWEKGVVSAYDLPEVEDNISLYLGDITTIKADAIVNAGNSYGLGCFNPTHRCIDNTIHTYAGIRLRLECKKKLKGRTLDNGEILVCKGYNLPCSYIITTVGPQITRDVTFKDEDDLSKCYENSLKYAISHHFKSIVFPCISTGLYGYPIKKAKLVAYNTVKRILKNRDIKVVFVVYSHEDYQEYEQLFPKKNEDV